MAPNDRHDAANAVLTWRPTKIMNMRDLSNDDDFLSHLLVEKLGTGAVPLYVHKMDPARRLPKTDARDLLQIVRRLVSSKCSLHNAIRQAVDDLLILPAIRYYLKSYTQKQINAFATHASRYLELYSPMGSIEIAHTSRYAHKTGKSELCILATRPLVPGAVITELKGSMANLTDEEDRELKRAGLRNSDIRRDFSVIHSKSMKKNHLFLGPARFVNHDCNNNCELFREGRYITFRVVRPINIGEEITAHYGDGYFGRRNRHCLCETCEKNGRGGYAPDHDDDDDDISDSTSNSDSESESEASASDSTSKLPLNVNERRTRRGVYAIVAQEEESDESENEEDNKLPLADAKDIPADGEIELTTDMDTASDLTSLTPSLPQDVSPSRDPMTPTPSEPLARSFSSLSSLSSSGEASVPNSNASTPFRSIISTRRQKVQEAQAQVSSSNASRSKSREDSIPATTAPSRRLTRSVSALRLTEQDKAKGKEREATSAAASSSETSKRGQSTGSTKEPVQVKKEEVDTRVLRTRPQPSVAPEQAKQMKPPPLRGADGKVLPTCGTCGNVLPVISVNSKIVWGLGFDGKRKKKHDCPRCLRHFAIYNLPWPRRIPPHGASFSTTPRESTPVELTKRVTQKALPVLDRKLAAAVSATKRARRHDSRDEEPPSKRQKTSGTLPSSLVVKLQPPSASTVGSDSVGASQVKKPLLPNSTSAHEIPETPKHNSHLSKEVVTETGSGDKFPDSPETIKRKRGRPRLSDKLINTPTVKVEETMEMETMRSPVSGKTITQPRNTNGRFGKKDAILKAQQRAARAAASSTGTASEGGVPRREKSELPRPTRFSLRRKRDDDSHSSDESSSKRMSLDYMDDEPPLQKVLPRRLSTFKGATLVSNPNPLSFALHAWAGPVLLDDSSSTTSSEDEKGLDTPEDQASPPAATIVDPMDEQSAPLISAPPPLPRGSLTYKPSPFTYAKRRWASVSLGNPKDQDSDGDDLSEERMMSGKEQRVHAKQLPGQCPHGDEVTRDVTSRHMSPISDNCSSLSNLTPEDEAAMRLVHVYPVVPKSQHPFIHNPRPMQFCPQAYADATKPNFIHAGWDDMSSDMSDA